MDNIKKLQEFVKSNESLKKKITKKKHGIYLKNS